MAEIDTECGRWRLLREVGRGAYGVVYLALDPDGQRVALEEALRRIKPDVNPEHYAAFVAGAIDGQDTESVTRLYGISNDNLYQIRRRLTAKLRDMVASVLAEMGTPTVESRSDLHSTD